MKKLLFQLDTDPHPSVFDIIVAYDGGADHVSSYSNCVPKIIPSLVEGAIFTRPENKKRFTALFIGGSDIKTGESVLDAVKNVFFGNFRVSVMFDCNGCNTTAAAAVSSILQNTGVTGKKAVILAGTGPVGGRAAVMLARSGADVAITSRSRERSAQVCQRLGERFGVEIQPLEARDHAERAALIEKANIVLATGAAGAQLLEPGDWRTNPNIEVIADANAVPPAGIGGIEMTDKGDKRHGKVLWGALGFGALKLALQRRCIGNLFERNDLILDTDEIFNLAGKLV